MCHYWVGIDQWNVYSWFYLVKFGYFIQKWGQQLGKKKANKTAWSTSVESGKAG